MDTGLYISLSGQLALDRRLQSIAANVANASTAGYRAEVVSFEKLVSRVPPMPASFASESTSHVSLAQGGFSKTGNPLDVAIQGSGFIAIQTPDGIAYTRDGRMQMLASGDLMTLNGHAVLDAGGAPLKLDPAGGPIAIARDGMITQNGRQLGAVGLFAVDLASGYKRYENASFFPAKQAEPVLSFTADGFVSGFVEESNVNAVTQITELIKVQRAFESLASTIDDMRASERSAIQTLGSRGG